jgi:hypothetical protein
MVRKLVSTHDVHAREQLWAARWPHGSPHITDDSPEGSVMPSPINVRVNGAIHNVMVEPDTPLVVNLDTVVA